MANQGPICYALFLYSLPYYYRYHFTNIVDMDTLLPKESTSTSKKLLKLVKYFVRGYVTYIIFYIVLCCILKRFDLYTEKQTSIIGLYEFSTILIITAYTYLSRVDKNLLKKIKTKFWPRPSALLISLVLFILSFIFDTLASNIMIKYAPNAYTKYLKDLADQENYFQLIYKDLDVTSFLIVSITAVCILPALGEELFFRGILQNIFLTKLKKTLPAMAISALLFSAVHCMPYAGIFLFFKGLLYSSIYASTGSLFLPMFGHFLNNIICTLARDYPSYGAAEAMQTKETAWVSMPLCLTGMVICLSLGYVCFRALYLDRQKRTYMETQSPITKVLL